MFTPGMTIIFIIAGEKPGRPFIMITEQRMLINTQQGAHQDESILSRKESTHGLTGTSALSVQIWTTIISEQKMILPQPIFEPTPARQSSQAGSMMFCLDIYEGRDMLSVGLMVH